MSNVQIILYACLAVFLVVSFYLNLRSPKVLKESYDWQKEKTQECIDLAEKSLKAQEDMAKTLKDIKTLLEKR